MEAPAKRKQEPCKDEGDSTPDPGTGPAGAEGPGKTWAFVPFRTEMNHPSHAVILASPKLSQVEPWQATAMQRSVSVGTHMDLEGELLLTPHPQLGTWRRPDRTHSPWNKAETGTKEARSSARPLQRPVSNARVLALLEMLLMGSVTQAAGRQQRGHPQVPGIPHALPSPNPAKEECASLVVQTWKPGHWPWLQSQELIPEPLPSKPGFSGCLSQSPGLHRWAPKTHCPRPRLGWPGRAGDLDRAAGVILEEEPATRRGRNVGLSAGASAFQRPDV